MFAVGNMGPSERSTEPTITAPWNQYDQCVGHVQPELVGSRLDLVVISAPKTGATWLQENLVCHEDILAPTRESKYVCTFWWWYDIDRLSAMIRGSMMLLKERNMNSSERGETETR